MTIGSESITWVNPDVRANRLRTIEDHIGEPDLPRIVELASPKSEEIGLDFITGLGNVALLLAPLLSRIEAVDPDPELVQRAATQAKHIGISNINFSRSDPDSLSFQDSTFDLVTARLALRHTDKSADYLSEIKRVMKQEGRAIFADSLAPDSPDTASFQLNLMKQRDASFAKILTMSEWENLLDKSNLAIEHIEIYPKEHAFDSWAKRLGADDNKVKMMAMLLRGASSRIKRHFRIVEEMDMPVSFVTWMILIRASSY